jgi:rod shape-determining protein MreC
MRFIYTKAFAWFAVCVVIITALVFLQVKGWLGPIKTVFLKSPQPVIAVTKRIVSPVKSFFSTIYRLRNIAADNVKLREKVAGLQQSLVDFDKEQKENETLRKELGFFKNTQQQLIPCTVLSQNFFGLAEAIVLDCGLEKGVAEGQVIMAQDYLVGKIIYAGKGFSTALLAISSQFSTDAKLSKTGANAIVRGSFGSGLILDQLPQNANVEKSWLVVTAGINDKIPKNLLIGEVGDVISGSNDLFKKTTLLSPVDFDNLEFVFAVKP